MKAKRGKVSVNVYGLYNIHNVSTFREAFRNYDNIESRNKYGHKE